MVEKVKIGVGFRVGNLQVRSATDRRKNGYTVWSCACDCGGVIKLDTRTLQRGTVRDCGCRTPVKPGQRDIAGQRFGKLVAIESTDLRNTSGTTIWRCRCDCGNEVLASLSQLTKGYKKSCGCLQARVVLDNMKFVDGTSVTALEKAGKRLLSTNTSGHNGVRWNQRTQKWIAQIGFKGKNYHLGSFARIEDAVHARKKAEERIYAEFLEWYHETHPGKKVKE